MSDHSESDHSESIQLGDVLITDELARRAARQPNLLAENQALRSLAQQLAHEPDQMLQRLVDLAVELCEAGTAGVSLAETQSDGQVVFRWVAMASDLASHRGSCVPYEGCPCGICLDQREPLLLSYPERYFTQFQQDGVPLVESLVLPLIAEGQALGTIWIITHDEGRQFDAEDVRLMTGLADFTAATLLRQQQQARELSVAGTALEQESTERKLAEAALQANAEQQAFLLSLSDALRPLADADAIRYQAACILGQHLGANRVGYAEADDNDATVVVTRNYTHGVSGIEGRYCYADYGAELLREFKAGRTVVKGDIAHDPSLSEAEKSAHAVLHLGATVNVPLVKAGRLVAVLFVHFKAAHNWSDRELVLITEVAERIWSAVRRVRAENALRESEAKYRTLFNSIDEGCIVIELVDDDGGNVVDYRYLQVNRVFERQTGLKNVVDKLGSEVAPQTEPYWLDTYDRVARTGQPHRIENYNADTGRWYSAYASRVGDAGSRRVAIVFDDITDRKRSEATLMESEKRFRLMADAVPQIVWITDAEGRVEFFNRQWTTYTGVPYEPTTAADVAAKHVHPEDGPRTMAAFSDAQQRGGIFEVEHRIRSASGAYRWFLVRAEPYHHPETGEIIRWYGSSTDIHDRKQAAATLAADLEDTQRLHDLATRLMTEGDRQTLYQEVMAAAIALTRADAGTVQILDEETQALVLLATQGFDPFMVDHFYRVNASSNTSCGLALTSGERTFIDFDGPEREDPDGSCCLHVEAGLLSAQSTPLVTRAGKAIGMVSTHWRRHHRPSDRELRFLDLLARQAADLIEQRRTEQERQALLQREQAAREEAEHANRVKDEFLAILSHELRSPLNPILGWSQMLQSKSLTPAQVQQALATIERNARLQTQLIDDLLDVNRILRGKLSLSETTVNLATAIEAAMDVVKTAAQAKSIALQFKQSEPCLVRGDEGRLQQIVWNLLSNAIKFTPNGGKVAVRLGEVGEVGEVGATPPTPPTSPTPPTTPPTPQPYAQITVTDTGQGISPDFMPYIFQSFRQEDASITRQHGGLGLGLAIVRYLVDAHGGQITAHSPGLGQGATFIVQLPLLRAARTPPADSQAAPVDLTGLRVLAVDDSEDTRELLTMILDAYGAETRVAASGMEVLANLATFSPDILLCDIGMPDMDGYNLLQQIRTLPDTQGRRIPAIAVTAFARDEDRQRALMQGFQLHIAKPIEPQELVRAIAQLAMQ